MSLVFEAVDFSYADGQPALRDVSLTIDDGSFVGIVGQTGSGKTTLAQLADALLVPDAGRVLVDGLDTADKHTHAQIRRTVGLVFQYPEQQLFASTVADDVAFGPKNLGLDADEVERRVREALTRMDLAYDDIASRSPFELSGGQQRRVALAGTLAMEPEFLVLDEPAAGMDPRARADLNALLSRLHEEGMGIVLISHSMEDVAALCEQVVVLDDGRVVLDGPCREVFCADNAATLDALGLALPRPTRFAADLQQAGLALDTPVLTTDDLVEALTHTLSATSTGGA
ncbi:MAG: energy-coupling factor transporter ATPase [Coriobacteriaceae bacterium]|nr:energy-coupling factor transporter ATPase [Coriobacteriaceae bacterium]